MSELLESSHPMVSSYPTILNISWSTQHILHSAVTVGSSFLRRNSSTVAPYRSAPLVSRHFRPTYASHRRNPHACPSPVGSFLNRLNLIFLETVFLYQISLILTMLPLRLLSQTATDPLSWVQNNSCSNNDSRTTPPLPTGLATYQQYSSYARQL